MQVLKVWKEHNAAVNRMDLQAMISVFSQDNFISAYADGSSFENLKELENTVSRVMLEQRSGQQILDEKIKVLVLSADYVLLNQEFLFEITHENYQITL